MKLLILTQTVDRDDPILGFFCRWIEEFSKRCEKVTVICLKRGRYEFPDNVKVLSLGKENGTNRIKYVWNFFKYLRRERHNYSAVFVHMNPIYLVLAGWWWKLTGKRISLWYTHRQVDLKLRIAEKFSDRIFTASKDSFRLSSQKVKIVGHGIPLDLFAKPHDHSRDDSKFRLISVGRITPIKNLDILIRASAILRHKITNLEVLIVGEPVHPGDQEYLEKLQRIVQQEQLEPIVHFVGSVPNERVREYYWKSDISVNLCPTGGVDKAVLESMASGLPVFVSNRGFQDYLGRYQENLMFLDRDPNDLADKIIRFKEGVEQKQITDFLLTSVRERSSLTTLISKINEEMQ